MRRRSESMLTRLLLVSMGVLALGGAPGCGADPDPSTRGSGGASSPATGGVEASTGGVGAIGEGGTPASPAGGALPTGGTVAAGGTAATGGTSTGGAGGAYAGGAASGGSSSGTGGGDAIYDPCPMPPDPCRIMPSGDSITVGAQSTDTGGYRVPLFRMALQDDKNLTFVGPSGAGPATVDGVAFPDAHDGHSGYVIDTIDSRKGLLPLVADNLVKHEPHIVLLMIGTNDINTQLDLPNAPTRLAALVDRITTTAPDALLVVAQLIPTRTDSLNEDVETFNAAIPGIVSDQVAAGKHVLLIDMFSPFTADPSYKTNLLFDGLHPNDAGYAVMAQVWYDAISEWIHR